MKTNSYAIAQAKSAARLMREGGASALRDAGFHVCPFDPDVFIRTGGGFEYTADFYKGAASVTALEDWDTAVCQHDNCRETWSFIAHYQEI